MARRWCSRHADRAADEAAAVRGETCRDAKLPTGKVRVALLALAEAAQARRRSHESRCKACGNCCTTLSRAVSRYLGGRRGAPLRHAWAYAAPALLVLGTMTGLAAAELHRIAPATALFVELLRAVQTTEPTIALRGALRPFLDRGRSAFRATHLVPSLNAGDRSRYISGAAIAGLIADTTQPDSMGGTDDQNARVEWPAPKGSGF
jgi:hypothetical protein